MIPRAVARRYARALLGLLQPTAIEPARSALRELSSALASSQALEHVLRSPAVPAEQKVDLVVALGERVGSPPELTRFLGQLAVKNRVSILSALAEEFSLLADKRAGIEQVTITAAVPLSSSDREQLDQRLRSLLGRQVDLHVRQDPRLLAGVKIQIGSMAYDSSLRARLGALKTVLTKE